MCPAEESFYSSGYGDRLIDPSKYPKEIARYLEEEEKLLSSYIDKFDLIIEVGCMNGRYLDWAVNHDKRYLGIDVVERYVKNGQNIISSYGLPLDRYQIEVCDASMIHELPFKKNWIRHSDNIFVIFPFNSFGNMDRPHTVLNSLSKMQKPFLICSYEITNLANEAREQYYNNCNYKHVRCVSDNTGVRFISADGLSTVAYNPIYLKKICAKNHFHVELIKFSSIGIAYECTLMKDDNF